MKNMVLNPELAFGVNNCSTTFLFRLGYAVWVLKGANLLKPLSYYGKMMDRLTDDTETLRGAYGPRMRRWVGPDALQESINLNMNIDNKEEYTKPAGIDQIEAAYRDLEHGMGEAAIQIFDPALDFEETNYVPDLHRVSFIKVNEVLGGVPCEQLEMILDYLSVDESGQLFNDMFALGIVQLMYCSFLGIKRGAVCINIGKVIAGVGVDYEDLELMRPEGDLSMAITTGPEKFWAEFDLLLDFEKHMRMQVNDKTFQNSEVSVEELGGMLRDKYLSKFENTLLSDIGNSMLFCAIIKYCADTSKYNRFLGEIYKSITLIPFIDEARAYAKSMSVTSIEEINNEAYAVPSDIEG